MSLQPVSIHALEDVQGFTISEPLSRLMITEKYRGRGGPVEHTVIEMWPGLEIYLKEIHLMTGYVVHGSIDMCEYVGWVKYSETHFERWDELECIVFTAQVVDDAAHEMALRLSNEIAA